MGVNQAVGAFQDGILYLRAEYNSTKEILEKEKINLRNEEMRQGLINDYDSILPPPKINTSSIDFNDGQHPDSLAGTA